MQTRWHSTLEVSLDFAFSILINLAGQRLFYGTLATAGRMTVFAIAVLGLAYARRYTTRRLFDAMTPGGQRQSRRQSALEAMSDTILGLLIAYVLQVIVYGAAATVVRAGGLTVVVYGLTMLRRYVIRRLFVAYEARTA
jgi:hypothetical protein